MATTATSVENNIENDVEALKPRYRTDKHIWGIYITLIIISIVELYSASSREVTFTNIYGPIAKHLMHLGIGLAIILFLQRIRIEQFFRWTPVFVLISIGMMIYVMFFGQVVNGARRSFNAVVTSIYPAEFMKISAVLLIAYILCKCQRPKEKDVETWGLAFCAVMITLFGAMLFPQGLTNTLLLMAISMSMFLISGVGIKKFLILIGIYIFVGGTGYLIKSHYDKDNDGRSGTWNNRIERFFSPNKFEEPITTLNRQEQYSYIAQANGGLVGVGPGNSRESARLPLAFSDYIYAIVVEDLGFIGGMCVLVLYLWLMARASALAWKCERIYPALLVMGMAVFVTMQALFHMAIVTGVFPVSGQPLPLISKGGTSIIITSAAFGIMLSVSRHALRKDNRDAIEEDISNLPEELIAPNPTQMK